MRKSRLFNMMIIGLAVLFLAGCQDKILVATPVADAGPDQNVAKSDTVTLDGSGSTDPNGDPLTYLWTMTSMPLGSTAVLDSVIAVNPTFVADLDGVYTFDLVVNDGRHDSQVDSVTITAQNSAPIANAGPDQNLAKNQTVTLDGSGSLDPNGDPITYLWNMTAVPLGSTAVLSSTTAIGPTFLADLEGTYTIDLVVNDGTVDSAVDTVVITTTNTAPVADAGTDQSLHAGGTATLDGTGSFDADSDPITYLWTLNSQPAASVATITNPTQATASLTTDDDGPFVVQLVVNDGFTDSAPVTITVTATNATPVANAGANQSGHTGATHNLDGSASSDGDSDPLTYSWTITGAPGGSTAAIVGPTLVNPTITTDLDGLYTIQLVVNDGFENSLADSMTITATPNVAPVAAAGPDQTVDNGNLVNLDGSGSSDGNGDVLTYLWSIDSAPATSGASLSSAIAMAPTFTPDVAGTYGIGLIVDDGALSSPKDTVVITATNTAPVANAGADQAAAFGSMVVLDGSGSSDINNDPLTYTWSIDSAPGGSVATISGPNSMVATFTPDVLGSYTISLVVNDGTTDSPADTMVISSVIPAQDTGQTGDYTATFGEDSDYTYFPPSFTDNLNGTVTDDWTGLMWQQQDDDAFYNWFEATGTFDGTFNPATTDVCGSLPLAGFGDWRLPTRQELLYVLNYGNTGPAVDGAVFTGVPLTFGEYWTDTVHAGDPAFAWTVDMSLGRSQWVAKGGTYYVRCVRNGPMPGAALTDNGDGTVTDTTTSLVWQQQDDGISKNWDSALGYCEGLSLAAATDWRVPNLKELASIIDTTTTNPSATEPPFTATSSNLYWSSTSDEADLTTAWGVFFNNGDIGTMTKAGFNFVRCVRGGM